MKKGIPAVYNYGEDAKPLAFDTLPTEGVEASTGPSEEAVPKKTIPPKQDEFIWAWKVSVSFVNINDTADSISITIAGTGN
jgi:ribosome production factor 1